MGAKVVLLVFAGALFSAGCSPLLPAPERAVHLDRFLGHSERYALYHPTFLHSEDKVRFLGEDSGEKFSRRFGLEAPVTGLIEQFLASSPRLSPTRLISPAEAGTLGAPWDEPVLFFYSTWRLLHRRIPPSFQMNQLEVGVIAKVIPLGQVLSGKGPLDLRTASWEGRCHFKAFSGEFFHLEDWAAGDGARLREGIAAAQAFCGEKLASEFSAARNP